MNTNLLLTNFRADLGEQRFVTKEARTANRAGGPAAN